MKRETPNQKLRRELLLVRQQLFKVCTEPDSPEAAHIIFQQTVLQMQSLMPHRSFYDQLKELGFGQPPTEYKHWEEPVTVKLSDAKYK